MAAPLCATFTAFVARPGRVVPRSAEQSVNNVDSSAVVPFMLRSSVFPASGIAGSAALLAAISSPVAATDLPPAPSGVDMMPEPEQALIVIAIFFALAVLTALVVGPFFRVLEKALPEGWFANWRATWPIVGAVYMVAGVSHFAVEQAFEAIYPPQGTWGFWYLPGSPQFHVEWSGIAEVAGGSGLFLGAIAVGVARFFGKEPPAWLRAIPSFAALGLFLLTWAVTPANIYMYTHGAQMVGLTPGDQPIPIEFHVVRGVLQVLLLSLLWGYYNSASSAVEDDKGTVSAAE